MQSLIKVGVLAGGLGLWLGSAQSAFPQTSTSQEVGGTAGVDLYSIAEGRVDDPDIAWSRRIPAVNEEITISARVRGTGVHPVPVQFALEATGAAKTVDPARCDDRGCPAGRLPPVRPH